jgi:hypothetical protein
MSFLAVNRLPKLPDGACLALPGCLEIRAHSWRMGRSLEPLEKNLFFPPGYGLTHRAKHGELGQEKVVSNLSRNCSFPHICRERATGIEPASAFFHAAVRLGKMLS